MAKIGIDARLYGVKHTGIGRYVQNLVCELTKIDKRNEYVVFGPKEILDDISGSENFSYHELNTPVYGFAEQLTNLSHFNSQNLDLLHVPHFNAPVLYQKKLVLTIHDLIKSKSIGPQTSTLPAPIYFFKHIVYENLIRWNINRSAHIITPSNYWKEYLCSNFKLRTDKVTVTYEAASGDLKDTSDDPDPQVILKKYSLNKPFLLYTGNLYPHKNVPFLIKAVEAFNNSHKHQLELVIIGARNSFANKLPTNSLIKVLGFVPDQDLSAIYKQSLALVQPSLIEGFGLTGLEAMSIGTPVLSSNTSCLPEIYQDAALYFSPHDLNSLLEAISLVFSDRSLVDSLILKGYKHAKKFSWKSMAKQTLKVYQSLL